METANYSLNNKNKYIIKTYDNYNNTEKKYNNTKIKYNDTEIKYNDTKIKYDTEIKYNDIKIKYNDREIQNTEKKYNNTHLFDKHCIELYGNKTCILFYIDMCNIEVRLLDHIRYNKNGGVKYINKNLLYNEIPNLLKNNYTVVLVEHILNTNTMEITSIHLPPK